MPTENTKAILYDRKASREENDLIVSTGIEFDAAGWFNF